MTRRKYKSALLAASLVAALFVIPLSAQAQTGPCLELSHDSLFFSGDHCDSLLTDAELDTLSIAVMNCGTGTLDWYVIADYYWLGFSPSYGTDFDSIYTWIRWNHVPVDPDTLVAGDTVVLQNTLRVFASDASPDTMKNVSVLLTLTCSGDGVDVDLMVQPTSFSFTADEGEQFSSLFFAYEAHGRNIPFDYSNTTSWLSLPLTFAPLYTPDSVEFWVETTNLNPGTYYDTITVWASDSNGTAPVDSEFIPVTLTVQEAPPYSIEATPDFFEYHLQKGDSVIGESLYVSETSGASINFWTYNQENWLFVDTIEASPLYTPEHITFDIHTDGMSTGLYTDSIYVWGDSAGADPFYVAIQLHVEDTTPAVVATQPTSIEWTLQQNSGLSDSLYVYEESGRNVPFRFTYSAPWLVVEPFGIGPYNTPYSLTVLAATDSLAPGTYVDTIHILPLDTPSVTFPVVEVPVTLTVTEAAPEVLVSQSQFWFTLPPDYVLGNRRLIVYEQSGENLEFAVDADPGSGWLKLQTVSAVMPDTVIFAINTTGLVEGAYADTLVIYNPLDGSQPYFEVRVPVNLHVGPDSGATQYVVQADPPSLYWRLQPGFGAYDNVILTEQSGGSTFFHMWNKSSWMTQYVKGQNSPPYQLPCTLAVYNIDSSLAPGMYYDTITIWPDTDGVSFEPVDIPVTLEMLPQQDVFAHPNHFEFSALPGDSVTGNSFLVLGNGGTHEEFDIILQDSSSWIDWQHPSGNLTVMPTTPDTVYFDIYADGLSPGIYADTFLIFNPTLDGPDSEFEVLVPVTLQVVGDTVLPRLQVDPSMISLTIDGAADRYYDTLQVTEAHGWNVDFYSRTTAPPLMELEGAANGWTTPTDIPLTIHIDTLPLGVYYDTLFFTPDLAFEIAVPPTAVPVIINLTNTPLETICGDVNGDGKGPDISDLTYLVEYMFKGGPPPPNMEAAKVSSTEALDITDLTRLVNYMFRNGPSLSCPFMNP